MLELNKYLASRRPLPFLFFLPHLSGGHPWSALHHLTSFVYFPFGNYTFIHYTFDTSNDPSTSPSHHHICHPINIASTYHRHTIDLPSATSPPFIPHGIGPPTFKRKPTFHSPFNRPALLQIAWITRLTLNVGL